MLVFEKKTEEQSVWWCLNVYACSYICRISCSVTLRDQLTFAVFESGRAGQVDPDRWLEYCCRVSATENRLTALLSAWKTFDGVRFGHSLISMQAFPLRTNPG
eukprot:scpid10487/ scgid35216/ 